MLFNNTEYRDKYGGRMISRLPSPKLSNGLPITDKHLLDFSQASNVAVTSSQLEEIKQTLIRGKTYTAGSDKTSRTLAIILCIVFLIFIPLLLIVAPLLGFIQNSDIEIEFANMQELFSILEALFTEGLPVVFIIIFILIITILPGLLFFASIIALCIFLFQHYKKHMNKYTDAITNGQIDIYDFPVTDKYYMHVPDEPSLYFLEIGETPVEVMNNLYKDIMIGNRVRCAIITGTETKYFFLL